MKILLVDDDPKFRRLMQAGLSEHGITCTAVPDAPCAEEALEAEGAAGYDAILLDVMLPGPSGWDFLQDIRARGDRTPVLFVTARHAVEERVKGLRLGADDYIIKPFELPELLARVEAVQRRHRQVSELAVGDLRLDPERRTVERSGARVDMSPREFEVLHVLLKNKGRVMTRSELLEEVWGIGFDPGTNVVNVVVARLRRKVERPGQPLIETVVGQGYRIADPSGASA